MQSMWLSALVAVLSLLAATASADPVHDGEVAYQKGDYEQALRLWRPLATQGDAEAQQNLGRMYEIGRGVPKDKAQAILWYRKAAEQDNAAAQYRLGMTYIYGQKPTADDIVVGLSWFEKAADQGYVDAQQSLGEIYEFGNSGVRRDHAKAVAWFRKAAQQGDARSLDRLISFAMTAGDYAEAIIWARKLAELGEGFGQFTLGVMYAEGLGVSKDRTQALAWLQRAASQHGDFSAIWARKYLEQLENSNSPSTPPTPRGP